MCKKLKNLKKNRKKFDKIFKKFWKFSKSENQKILKLIFGQKKTVLPYSWDQNTSIWTVFRLTIEN